MKKNLKNLTLALFASAFTALVVLPAAAQTQQDQMRACFSTKNTLRADVIKVVSDAQKALRNKNSTQNEYFAYVSEQEKKEKSDLASLSRGQSLTLGQCNGYVEFYTSLLANAKRQVLQEADRVVVVPPPKPAASAPVGPTTSGVNNANLAVDGGSFTLSTTQMIRYGKDSTWIAKSFSAGNVVCLPSSFGGVDPVPGVQKSCQVAPSGTVATVPVAAPVTAGALDMGSCKVSSAVDGKGWDCRQLMGGIEEGAKLGVTLPCTSQQAAVLVKAGDAKVCGNVVVQIGALLDDSAKATRKTKYLDPADDAIKAAAGTKLLDKGVNGTFLTKWDKELAECRGTLRNESRTKQWCDPMLVDAAKLKAAVAACKTSEAACKL